MLMLHGGKEHSEEEIDARSLSWLRMAALQRVVTPAVHPTGSATWLLRYRVRGWNGGAPTGDARWALDEVRRQVGDVPVVLLGHSMGARTAVNVAGDPAVVGVVALAPWFPPGETVAGLAGKVLRAAHGRGDRVTSFAATRTYVDRAATVAASATMQDMGPAGHYLLRRVGAWNAFAKDSILQLLRG